MLTQAQRKERIDRIGALPATLESAVAGMNEGQLDTPYRKGGWTVRQVVHHLADSHMNAFIRTKLILTEDHPTLKPYLQEKWAELPDTAHAPIGESLTILSGLHRRWLALLEQVRDDQWGRTAFHPESGEMTLESILETYARHGDNHVKQITDLRASRRW